MGVLVIQALLFGIYVRAPEFIPVFPSSLHVA